MRTIRGNRMFADQKANTLDDICGRKAALDCVANFNLQGGVCNAEAIAEVVRELIEKRVAWMTAGHHQVDRHCDRCRAQPPYMYIGLRTDARASLPPSRDGLSVHRGGHGIER